MTIQITIRGVSEKVRDELAARAASQGKSMQEFLRAELERMAARPSVEAWLQQVARRKRAAQTRVSSSQILKNRDADRRGAPSSIHLLLSERSSIPVRTAHGRRGSWRAAP